MIVLYTLVVLAAGLSGLVTYALTCRRNGLQLAQARTVKKVHKVNLPLEHGWVVSEIGTTAQSAIAAVTLKRHGRETAFTRIDLGKGWPIDPVPSGLNQRDLTRVVLRHLLDS